MTPTTSGRPLSSAHIIAAFDAIRDYREAVERAVVDEQRARFQARIDEIESRRLRRSALVTRIDFEADEQRKLAGSTGPRAFGINVYEHTWRAVLDDGQEVPLDHEEVCVLPDRVRRAVDAAWRRFRVKPLTEQSGAAQRRRLRNRCGGCDEVADS